MTRDIGFLVYPDFQLLDLSGPLVAFQIAGRLSPGEPYRLHVVSRHGGSVASSSGLAGMTPPLCGSGFHTFLLVAGGMSQGARRAPTAAAPATRSRRIATVCTRAFSLSP